MLQNLRTLYRIATANIGALSGTLLPPNYRTMRLDSALIFLVDDERQWIPAGFITDFASIPRVFWCIFPPTGSYAPVAVIHDYVYRYANLPDETIWTRKQADDLMLALMAECETGWLARWSIYSQVRAWGWITWNKYRSLNSKSRFGGD